MRVLLCLFIFLALSCSSPDSDPTDDCISVTFDNSKFNSTQNFGVSLTDYTLDGNCLKVTLGFSGCDDDHTIEMLSDGSIAESLPPQITFDFYDEKPQACQAYFLVEREYDLSPINELYDDDIIIRFRNNDKSLTFSQ